MSMKSWKKPIALTAAVLTALSVTSCGTGDDGGEGSGGQSITVWTLESLPDRMEITEGIIADFTEKTGIEVDLVGVEEGQVTQLIQSAGLSGDLPDVVAAFPLGVIHEMSNLEMIDTEATQAIIDSLGEETFQSHALALNQTSEGVQIGVPSDGWSQILVYRTDRFEEKGLDAPDTYENLQKAAEELTEGDQFGITLATDPSDVFTQQTFESLALGNNCELIGEDGAITIDSPECQEAFELYNALAESSPAGAQTVDSTRAAYFNGSASMTMWSTYLLDELAGLRNDALPACPECADDPGFLAENTGVITKVEGPNGAADDGAYGEITSFAPVEGGNVDASKQFIEYMMSDGYEDWLAMAPEGKFPMRTGTADEPTKFSDAWANMETGVDQRAPLGDFYSDEVIDTLTSMGENVSRWALPQGKGDLLGSFTAELPLAKAVSEMASGSRSPSEAASEVKAATEEMAK